MITLTEFLLARFAEDDSAAFFAEQDEGIFGRLVGNGLGADDHRVTHAYRWRPERVRAESAAKRQIVEFSGDVSPELMHGRKGDPALEVVLRFLALPYADHRDWREEWRP